MWCIYGFCTTFARKFVNIMRKFTLIMVLIWTSIAIHAQQETVGSVLKGLFANQFKTKAEIISDRVDAQNIRRIRCSHRWTNRPIDTKKGHCIQFEVSGENKDDWSLLLIHFWTDSTEPLIVKTDSPVLIKSNSGRIWKTHVYKGGEDVIGRIVNASPKVTSYNIMFSIELNQDLCDFLVDGFDKMRIELSNDIYDIDPAEDNVSDFILEEADLIRLRFQKKRKFEDGF